MEARSKKDTLSGAKKIFGAEKKPDVIQLSSSSICRPIKKGTTTISATHHDKCEHNEVRADGNQSPPMSEDATNNRLI